MLGLPQDNNPLEPLLVRAGDPTRQRSTGKPAMPGGFSLSAPAAMPLDENLIGEDAELTAFWKGKRDQFSFDYVTFRCDFAPAGEGSIEKAFINVSLESDDSAGARIWSMSPALEANKSTRTQSAAIGAEFQLLGMKLGPKGEIATEQTVENWFIRARQISDTHWYWELRDNGSSHIEGMFRMNLVVRRPAGKPVVGRIAVEFVVEHRSFLIFKERDAVVGEPASFRLPSD